MHCKNALLSVSVLGINRVAVEGLSNNVRLDEHWRRRHAQVYQLF